MNTLLFLVSATSLGAYICRLDALSWHTHKFWVVAVHYALAAVTAKVMTQVAEEDVRPVSYFLVAVGVVWLAYSYRRWHKTLQEALLPKNLNRGEWL